MKNLGYLRKGSTTERGNYKQGTFYISRINALSLLENAPKIFNEKSGLFSLPAIRYQLGGIEEKDFPIRKRNKVKSMAFTNKTRKNPIQVTPTVDLAKLKEYLLRAHGAKTTKLSPNNFLTDATLNKTKSQDIFPKNINKDYCKNSVKPQIDIQQLILRVPKTFGIQKLSPPRQIIKQSAPIKSLNTTNSQLQLNQVLKISSEDSKLEQLTDKNRADEGCQTLDFSQKSLTTRKRERFALRKKYKDRYSMGFSTSKKEIFSNFKKKEDEMNPELPKLKETLSKSKTIENLTSAIKNLKNVKEKRQVFSKIKENDNYFIKVNIESKKNVGSSGKPILSSQIELKQEDMNPSFWDNFASFGNKSHSIDNS